jgi:hypothetical protein
MSGYCSLFLSATITLLATLFWLGSSVATEKENPLEPRQPPFYDENIWMREGAHQRTAFNSSLEDTSAHRRLAPAVPAGFFLDPRSAYNNGIYTTSGSYTTTSWTNQLYVVVCGAQGGGE